MTDRPERTCLFPDLEGVSVFITGGGAGIGAALTEAFVGQGARVAFVQRSDATELCDRLEAAHGARPLFIPCDITDEAALKGAIARAAEAHGPITVLVNNAADDTRHDTLTLSSEDWDRCIAVNLKSYFLTTQAVVPMMQAAGGGVIVNFSSISYMVGMPQMTAYTTANGAITAMTRGHAREFGGDNIRVNAIAPGWVMTERQLRLWANKEALEEFLPKQCLPRLLVPEDIAAPVLFLASRASAAMTGQCIAVDGGLVTVAA